VAVVEEHVQGRPAPCLRPFIVRYGGSRRAGFAPREHAATPSRHVTLIVSFEDPIEICAMPEGLQRPGRFQSFVAGMHAAPARVRDRGRVHLVHAFLTPLGVRTLFGVPGEALAARVIPLGDLLGERARELEERLAAGRSWPERFAALDDVLARKLVPSTPRAEIAWAWRRLVAANGQVPIAALAREIGWSRRHFAERFRVESGLGPKAVARVLRFEHASSLFAASTPGGIVAVAAAAGYADQSHLTREWVAITGSTPRAWLADELPFLQYYELETRLGSPA